MKTVTSLMSMVVILTCCVLVTSSITQAESLSLGIGNSYLNQTLDGERGPNILATDFSFQLDRQDIGASYHARLHDDAVIWQRLEVGPRYGKVQAFYSLDLTNQMNLSGGGLRLTQIHNSGRSFSVTGGVYDRGFCFEGSCSVEWSGFVGKIGYEYRKLSESRWWGPGVSVGWGW